MEVQSIALTGLEKAQERLAAVAKRLSNSSSSSTSVASAYAGGDTVDLSATMVALLEAKNSAEANLKLVETANELSSQTINILG
jgi:flagellar basal body rod protein FlgC